MPEQHDRRPKRTLGFLKNLIAGLSAGGPGGATTIVSGGQSYPLGDFINKAQGFLTPYDTAQKAEDALIAATEARGHVEGDAMAFVTNATAALRGMLGPRSAALKNYGVKPEKEPTPLTGDQQVAKAAKANATRKARHTMGKKQKKAIKGQVPPSPAPPPATPSPATP